MSSVNRSTEQKPGIYYKLNIRRDWLSSSPHLVVSKRWAEDMNTLKNLWQEKRYFFL